MSYHAGLMLAFCRYSPDLLQADTSTVCGHRFCHHALPPVASYILLLVLLFDLLLQKSQLLLHCKQDVHSEHGHIHMQTGAACGTAVRRHSNL